MLPVLQVGPLAVQLPGLLLLLGLWLGLGLAERHAPRFGIPGSSLYNLAFAALLAGILGARMAYVLRYPAVFATSPLSLFSLNPGLLDAWGGAVAGLVVALAYGQRLKLSLWPTLDALTPALAVLAVFTAFAHLASGAAFGSPTSLPWAVELWGERRHPSQIYEILAAVLILALVWPGRGRVAVVVARLTSGSLFLFFMSLSAAARLFLEAFRGDSLLLPGGLRAAQVIAWLVLAGSLWALRRRQTFQMEAPG